MNPQVVQVVVGLPAQGPFDYSFSDRLAPLSPGQRVCVDFAGKKMIGFSVGIKGHSTYKKLKTVEAVLDTGAVVPAEILLLARQVADHYCCSWGEALAAALPSRLRDSKALVSFAAPSLSAPAESGRSSAVLLHDPANAILTPEILKVIQEAHCQGQGILVLVPENSLLDKIAAVLAAQVSPQVTVLDKRLKPSEELARWLSLREGRTRLAVGTRSAVFAPVVGLGLIVILKESDPFYKQDQKPFYHAVTVARMRAAQANVRLILCALAPTLEAMDQAKKNKMDFEGFQAGPTVKTRLIDLLNYNPRKTSLISVPLQQAIEEVLSQGGRALLFMNKKGFGSWGVCAKCHWTLTCPRCDVPLTYLYQQRKVVCRRCSHKEDVPETCPQCRGAYLNFSGGGIEKLQSQLARVFPETVIGLVDRENKKVPPSARIVVATQAILRLSAPQSFDLVALVAADAELHRQDFRSGFNAFSLLMELKTLARGQFLAQTRLADNYCLRAVARNDPTLFYRQELKFRRELSYPPFMHLIEVIARGAKKEEAREQAAEIHKALLGVIAKKNIFIFEPQPDIINRLRGQYRFIVLLKGKRVEQMTQAIRRSLKAVRRKAQVIVTVNVDP